MATGLTASELRSSSPEELTSKLAEAKEELFNLRFQSATGQLESHGRLRAVRKEIARIYTVLRERELGIIIDVEDETADVEGSAKGAPIRLRLLPMRQRLKTVASSAATGRPARASWSATRWTRPSLSKWKTA